MRIHYYRLLYCIIILYAESISGQTISINNNSFQTGIFGQNSTVAVPVVMNGCFKWNNITRVYLCNPSNPAGILVGTFSQNSFTTFINARIPNGTAARTDYYLQVRTTLPLSNSAPSSSFEIKNIPAPIAFINTTNNRKLIDSVYYGYCQGNPSTPRPITLTNQSTVGSITDISYKDEATGITTILPIDVGGIASLTLDVTYYTMYCKAAKDGVISTRAVSLVNPTHNSGLLQSGEQKACLPDALSFSIDTSSNPKGIGRNFPGVYYVYDWGDASLNDTITHCQMLALNGIVTHTYVDVSCNKTATIGSTTYPNAYPVDVKYVNPFKNIGNTNNCDEFSNAAFARIFRKPQANFLKPDYACVNSAVTFTNTTIAGIAQSGNNCSGAEEYEWYVDGALVSTNRNLISTFQTTGVHSIRLRVENASCAASEITQSICIESKPLADFKVNGLDSVADCASPNLQVLIKNLSNPSPCRAIWKWEVYNDSTGALVKPGAAYTILPNDTAFEPEFNFLTSGRYRIRLTATNSCGSSVSNKIVKVLGTSGVFLPRQTGYCGTDITIDFANNVNHKPTYNSDIGNEVYAWTVTGGNSSFLNGTSASSKYPVIQFTDYATYTVSVKFTNNCGTTAPTQQLITFSQPGAVDAKPDIDSICFDQNTIALTGTTTGIIDSVKWTTTGSGTFSATNNTSSIYTLSTADKNSGAALLILRAYNKQPSGCVDVKDTVKIKIFPRNFGKDSTRNICSGTILNFSPLSSVKGSTFSWQSTVVSGSVTGNTDTGSGLINDNLVNTDNAIDGVVKYMITPEANGCKGEAYALTVNIKAKPVLSAKPASDVVCSGQKIYIPLSSSVINSTFSWVSAVTSGTVTGNTNRSNQSVAAITDSLVNTSSADAIVTYKIVSLSATSCPGDTLTISITVSPGVTKARAGNDVTLCGQTQTNLGANAAVTGVGVWSQISGPPSTIADNSSPTTQITALTVGSLYAYVWEISSASTLCGNSKDTVIVTVLPDIVNTIKNDNVTICSGQSTTLSGAATNGGNGIYQYQWQQSFDNIVFTNITGQLSPDITVSPLTSTYYRRYVTSSPCSKYSDTVLITVQPGIGNNTISASQNICINTPASIITGTTPTGGNGVFSYIWESSPDGITWTTIPGANAKDYDPGSPLQTIRYRRRVNTSLCNGLQGAASSAVIITVNPDAKAEFNPTKTVGCIIFNITPAIINFVPYNDRVSEYRWYADTNYLGSGQVFPGYRIRNPGDSVTIKLVAISKFGCRNDTLQHGFKALQQPQPAFTQNDSIGCGPLTVTFTNTTPNANQYRYLWDFGNGQKSTSPQPPSITFNSDPLNGDTTYTVSFKTITDCDTIELKRYVTVQSKPKALFTPDKTNGCSPMIVTFTNTSRGLNNNYVWNFGDRSPLVVTNDIKIKNTFYVGSKDTFNVKLFATNQCGKDSENFIIIVNPNSIKLDVAVNGNERFGCLPHTVHFINNSSGANIYNWNFGDGGTRTTYKGIDTVEYQFTKAGTFTITLNGTNTCSDTTDMETITVQAKPVVSFTASPSTVCVGDTIRLISSGDTAINYLWKFGDGTQSVVASPLKTYIQPGPFRIWLIASKVYAPGNSCADSTYHDVTIRDTLPGSFTIIRPLSTCAPSSFTFKNTTGPASQTRWEFDDGSSGVGDSVAHIYNSPGTYVVKMITKAMSGCNYTSLQTITITGATGNLMYRSGYLCLGDNAQFEAVSNNSNSYRFIFGDGDSLSTSNNLVNHRYSRPGTYIPYAYLLSGNCETQIKTGDTIRVDRIKAGFKIDLQYSCGTTVISLTDTSNAFFGIRSRSWDLGDGTFSTQLNPSKTITQPGAYNIRLKITGMSGCTDTITIPVEVTVHSYPGSSIGGNAAACTNQPAVFTSLVQTQESLTSNWNFNNGVTASGVKASITYAVAGTYTVQLINRTAFGCTDTAYKTVNVNVSPDIYAGADTRICKGHSVQLNATGASLWQWSPLQNLSCYTCANPVATPTARTVYVATGNNTFCFASDTVIVDVIQPLHLTVSPNDSICIGSTTQLFASGATTYSWTPTLGIVGRPDIPNPIVNPSTTTVFRVVGTDQYSCFNDTAFVTVAVGKYPTLDLGNGATVVAGTPVNLLAVVTNGPITNYNWTPSIHLSCTNCGNPVATINNDITYKLEVKNAYGCAATDTISFKTYCDDSQIFIPNVFSPDGDKINDVFMVRGKGIVTINYFRVFNRWGQLVFERSNIGVNNPAQGWDGKVNGKIVQDVYVYSVEAVCTGGKIFKREGNVSLMIMR